jgi:hypothetical protein
MIDYARLAAELRARQPGFAAELPQIDDDDELAELVGDEQACVLALSWEPDDWGNSGCHTVTEWRGFYFFRSSDLDPEGPFPTLKAALDHDNFHTETPNAVLSAPDLPMTTLIPLGLDLTEDGEEIRINDQRFRRAGTMLVVLRDQSEEA